MEQPLVSIFLSYYNDRKYLSNAIESILNQTYQNWELILVNHATLDDSREIAHSYSDDRIRHVDFEKNYEAPGGYVFDEFIKKAQGKYIKPFCADDVLLPNCLERMVDYMESHPEKDFCFSNVQYVDKKTKYFPDNWFLNRIGFDINSSSSDLLYDYFNLKAVLPYIGSFIKREKITFPTDRFLIMLFDCSLWVNLLINGSECGFIDEILALYRIHDEQMSAVSNEQETSKRGELEQFIYFQFFEKISDLSIIKKLLDKWDYIQTLEYLEPKFIPFVFYYYYSTYGISPQMKYLGRCKLHEMIQDDAFRMKLEEKFNFGIENLRRICVEDPVYINFEQIRPIIVTDLDVHTIPFKKLVRLLFGKIWKKLIKLFKKKTASTEKQYSL